MKKRIFAVCLTVVMSMGILSGCVSNGNGGNSGKSTDNSWKKVKEKGKFILGLDENFPPMGFTDDKNNIVGFDIDIAREACTRLGIELEIKPIDWSAKDQELNTGNIDAVWNGFTINDERKEQVLFTEPYMKNRQILVVKGDSNVISLKDLSGKKLGLQAESSAYTALEKASDFKSSLKEAVEFKDNMTALMDLEKGGIDAVLMDEIVARYYIQNKGKAYKVLNESLAEEEYGVGFRKNDKELMENFQETLEAMAKDGKLSEISKSWFGEDITTIGK